jgi:hypothetical protein
MARSGRLHRTGHLVRRFCGSLRPGGPPSVDEVWVAGLLGDAELDLWRQMSGADRRHAVGVARRVAGLLDTSEGVAPDAPVMAAALLHDVGKVRSGLGTFGRVAATVLAAAAPGRVNLWPDRGGFRGRIGLYLRHPEEGAALLSAAGSAPVTVAWALEHHRPTDRWSVDRRLADVLHAADDD